MELRDYQEDLIERSRCGFRERVKRQLMVAPTGAGKTIIAGFIQSRAAENGHSTWFIAPRREIVEQTADKFRELGLDFGVVMDGEPENFRAPVQICSLHSLPGRMDRMDKPKGILWDEAHHIVAASFKGVLDQADPEWQLGLTATPQRTDGKGLEPFFDVLIEGPTPKLLIERGFLAPYRYFVGKKKPSLDGVRSRGNVLDDSDLGDIMGKPALIGDAIEGYFTNSPGRRGICFEASIAASIATAEAFRSHGVDAWHVDGDMHRDRRKELFTAMRDGQIDMLTNVDLAGEGVDIPGIEVVLQRRPTKSLTFFRQSVGRGFRLFPGKTEALFLDFVQNVFTHGMPDEDIAWSLEGHAKIRANLTANDARAVHQCSECFMVTYSTVRVCPCGHEFPVKVRALDQEDGELFALDREAMRALAEAEKQAVARARKDEERRCETMTDFIRLGRERGYANPAGWARMKMQLRTKWRRAA